jgi:hypothetical protein
MQLVREPWQNERSNSFCLPFSLFLSFGQTKERKKEATAAPTHHLPPIFRKFTIP